MCWELELADRRSHDNGMTYFLSVAVLMIFIVHLAHALTCFGGTFWIAMVTCAAKKRVGLADSAVA